MISNWSIIPITIVSKERPIKSGGLIFAPNNNISVFKWLIDLLFNKLPIAKIIKTICSDDDTGLNSAFNMIDESTD